MTPFQTIAEWLDGQDVPANVKAAAVAHQAMLDAVAAGIREAWPDMADDPESWPGTLLRQIAEDF
jgi:hypothetical protein